MSQGFLKTFPLTPTPVLGVLAGTFPPCLGPRFDLPPFGSCFDEGPDPRFIFPSKPTSYQA